MKRLASLTLTSFLIFSLTSCGLVANAGSLCEPAADGGYYLTDIGPDGQTFPDAFYDSYQDCQEAMMTGTNYPTYPFRPPNSSPD